MGLLPNTAHVDKAELPLETNGRKGSIATHMKVIYNGEISFKLDIGQIFTLDLAASSSYSVLLFGRVKPVTAVKQASNIWY